MYVMYARNMRTVDVGMRMGDVEDILNRGRKSERDAGENGAGEHVHVFPFAAVLLNSFAFSIAA
jgi:hypothetical protein